MRFERTSAGSQGRGMANLFGKSVKPVGNPRVATVGSDMSAVASPPADVLRGETAATPLLFTRSPSGWPVKAGKDRTTAIKGAGFVKEYPGKGQAVHTPGIPDERKPISPYPAGSLDPVVQYALVSLTASSSSSSALAIS